MATLRENEDDKQIIDDILAANPHLRKNRSGAVRWALEKAGQVLVLEARVLILETAIRAVLRYISSHQIYDKDAKGILERALEAES